MSALSKDGCFENITSDFYRYVKKRHTIIYLFKGELDTGVQRINNIKKKICVLFTIKKSEAIINIP